MKSVRWTRSATSSGACFCLHELGVEQIFAGSVNTGSGTVNTEHGVFPVPAPATADLLTGIPGLRARPGDGAYHPNGCRAAVDAGDQFWTDASDADQRRRLRSGRSRFPEHANILRVLDRRGHRGAVNRLRFVSSRRTSMTRRQRFLATPWTGCSNRARLT